jgi:hypothetical protein
MRPYKVYKKYLNLYTNTVQIEVPKVTKIPDKLPQNRYSNTRKAVPVNKQISKGGPSKYVIFVGGAGKKPYIISFP